MHCHNSIEPCIIKKGIDAKVIVLISTVQGENKSINFDMISKAVFQLPFKLILR